MIIKGIPNTDVNLSGNLSDIIINTNQAVDIKLFCEGDLLIDESYSPDENNSITFNIKELVNASLRFTIPNADFVQQSEIVKSFTLEIADETHNFSAIRTGLRALSLTHSQYLKANFLTWQPQQKNVLQGQPEYLSYYAVEDCKLMAKAYFADGTNAEKSLYTLNKGNAYTFNVSFGAMLASFVKQPVYWHIWAQNNTVRLSYIQRFILTNTPAEHHYFSFENSLGGLDVACFTGENIHKPQYDAQTALMKGIEIDYNTAKKDAHTQLTGWLSADAAAWLHDFFKSKSRFVAADGAMLPITLSETAPEKSNKDDLCSYSFTYTMGKHSDYINIIRNHAALPDVITIIDPANIPFDLAPRFVDFPEFVLSDIALFPVQSPFEQKWYKTSLGAIVKHMVTAVVGSEAVQSSHYHGNLAVLNSLTLSNGYLYTGESKIKAGFADNAALANHALTADNATLANRALTADNAILWDSRAFPNYLNQAVRTSDDVIHKSLTSPIFASGFAGAGWQLDKDARMTVDYLTVRKQMDVYELIINKIRATNGAIWVSDSAKIHSVVNESANYKCFIDTDNNKNPVPFQVNDIIRCQQWTGNSTKYYSATIASIGADFFTLVKSSFDGAGTPTAGDELVRIGNTSDTNRQGAIYLTSSDNNAPYIDVLDKVTSASLAGKTKLRLGKLSGIADADFGGALSGYGLYSDNAYIKGKIHVTGGNAATQTDAQNKANAAQTAAINAAATDAANKVNSLKNSLKTMAYLDMVELAKLGTTIIQGGFIKSNLIEVNAIKISGSLATTTDVNSAINNIQIGGTNLLPNSAPEKTNTFPSSAEYLLWDRSSVINEIYSRGEITISFDIKVAKLGRIQVYSSNSQADWAFAVYIENVTTEYQRRSVTVTPMRKTQYNTSKSCLEFYGIYGSGIIPTVKNVKIELGNKNTDWSAAPEDIATDAQNKANTALAAAKSYTDSLKSSLKTMAYLDMVELAKLGTTIIQGGFIKSNLIEVNAIKISGSFATTADVNTAKTAAATDAQTKANAAQAAAINAAAIDATNKTNTLKNTLKAMAYQDVVELAKLGTTIIQGGFIKSNLIDVNWLKANVITADFISALAVNFKYGKIGGFDISPVALSSQGMTLLAGSGQITWKKGNNQDIIIGGLDVDTIINNKYTNLYHTLAFLSNQKQSNQHNVALVVSAKNSYTENTAILMDGGCISGLAVKARRISTTQTLLTSDVYITCINTALITVTLPEPYGFEGKIIIVKRTAAAVTVVGGHAAMQITDNTTQSVSLLAVGTAAMFVFDGSRWQYHKIN